MSRKTVAEPYILHAEADPGITAILNPLHVRYVTIQDRLKAGSATEYEFQVLAHMGPREVYALTRWIGGRDAQDVFRRAGRLLTAAGSAGR